MADMTVNDVSDPKTWDFSGPKPDGIDQARWDMWMDMKLQSTQTSVHSSDAMGAALMWGDIMAQKTMDGINTQGQMSVNNLDLQNATGVFSKVSTGASQAMSQVTQS